MVQLYQILYRHSLLPDDNPANFVDPLTFFFYHTHEVDTYPYMLEALFPSRIPSSVQQCGGGPWWSRAIYIWAVGVRKALMSMYIAMFCYPRTVLQYLRPLLSRVWGETMQSPSASTAIKSYSVEYKAKITLSPVNDEFHRRRRR